MKRQPKRRFALTLEFRQARISVMSSCGQPCRGLLTGFALAFWPQSHLRHHLLPLAWAQFFRLTLDHRVEVNGQAGQSAGQTSPAGPPENVTKNPVFENEFRLRRHGGGVGGGEQEIRRMYQGTKMKTKQSYPAPASRGWHTAPRRSTALLLAVCVLFGAAVFTLIQSEAQAQTDVVRVPTGSAPAGPGNLSPSTPARFAVISDPHLYAARLGTAGSAFEDYLNQDPKLLRESEAILESALDSVIQQGVHFVLIPGDLTKDGEVANHVLMAQHLAKLEKHGIQAFVVPGNHDINNPDAVSFRGDSTSPVPTASPALFRAIYQRFGYGQALDRDTESLSYVVEPVPGLWVLGIDSTDTAQNDELGKPRVGGKLSPGTLAWMVAKVQLAQAQGKQVIAFMHHGVVPDFAAQPAVFADYLVDDWPTVNVTLAGAGLRVIFTGHYHAQDASYLFTETGTLVSPLCDVETSSLAAYPCAYRMVTVQAGHLAIESQRVTAITADTGGVPFQAYAEADLRMRIPAIATAQLENDFGLTHEQATQVTPLVVEALMAGYVGDEHPDAQTQAVLEGLLNSPEPLHTLGMLLLGLWTDLPPGSPGDNTAVLPLAGN